MELEFDKEIDALLRQAERASPVAAGAPSTGHLDADELATFAENALPELTRQTYVAHLADCDDCRMMLSGAVASAPEQAAAAAAAFAPVPETIPGAAAPPSWYKRLFATANLAYVMGTLVVLFSGIVGLLVYQDRLANRSAQISRATDSQPSAPALATNTASQGVSNGASSANSSSNTAASSPIEDVTRSGVAIGSGNSTTTAKPEDQPVTAGQSLPEPSPPIVVAAAPSAKEDDKVSPRDVKTEQEIDEKRKQEERTADLTATRSDDRQRTLKDSAPSAKSAQTRLAGPKQLNTQNQVENMPTMDGVSVTNVKTAGGKTFRLRDGVWYDAAYTGQSTKDVKRGTEKFLRLDAGLRAIADQIGGTVVVIWNEKAYKIK